MGSQIEQADNSLPFCFGIPFPFAKEQHVVVLFQMDTARCLFFSFLFQLDVQRLFTLPNPVKKKNQLFYRMV